MIGRALTRQKRSGEEADVDELLTTCAFGGYINTPTLRRHTEIAIRGSPKQKLRESNVQCTRFKSEHNFGSDQRLLPKSYCNDPIG